MRSLLIMLVLGAVTGVPQVDSEGMRIQGNSGESSAIEGRVLNTVTSEPLKKVDLILRRTDLTPNMHSPTSYTASTDESGRFVMGNLESGQYRLLAIRSGFVSGEYGAHSPAQTGLTLSLDAAHPLQNLVFRLTPHAVIAGRLTDANGEPAPNIQVHAMRYIWARGRRQLTSFGRASTNDLGEYRIVGLAPGRYYLSGYRTPVMFGQTTQDDYVTTYYPGTADATLAIPIDVTAGSEFLTADFGLAKTRTVRIRGRVANADRSSRSMITVTLIPTDQSGIRSPRRTYVTNPLGDFDIHGVTPDAYTFVASILEGGTYRTAKHFLDATNNVDDFTITIAPGREVRGSVHIDGDAKPNLADVRISLLPFDGSEILTPMPNAQVKPDGTFTLSNVSPDNYNLTVFEAPDGYYVKSIQMGDNDVMDGGFKMDESPNPIDIVLSPGAGQIQGAVLNARQQTATGATVVLIPQDNRRRKQLQFYSVTTTDQYGRFALKNLYPGSYNVFAWEELEYDAFMDPDFIKPVEDKGQTVLIQENSHTDVQLKLILAEESQQK